jgi:hypothetical protein
MENIAIHNEAVEAAMLENGCHNEIEAAKKAVKTSMSVTILTIHTKNLTIVDLLGLRSDQQQLLLQEL